MKIIKNFANKFRKKSSRKFMSKLSAFLVSVFISSITAITASADTPTKAANIADIKSNTLLNDVLSLLSGGVGLIGGFLIAWGIVQLALSVKENHGNNIEKGILTIVSGAMIVAAAVFFNVAYL